MLGLAQVIDLTLSNSKVIVTETMIMIIRRNQQRVTVFSLLPALIKIRNNSYHNQDKLPILVVHQILSQ